ncbi:hypothetical protein [Actinophytocola sediminis]
MTTPQRPSVSRIVHYTSHGSADGVYGKECRAAIVTAVNEYQDSPDGSFVGHVDLCVLNPTGQHFARGVLAEHLEDQLEPGPAGRTGGTWHWPERV